MQRSGGRLDPDGHDIGVVILLVVDRRRNVAQQAQRKLLFSRRPGRLFAQQRDPVLHIRVARRIVSRRVV